MAINNRLKIFVLFVTLAIWLASSAGAHSPLIIVKMTSNGFEPNILTVHENTTIQFVNQDIVDRWPASNVHPTHDLYPEFDSKKPVKPGDFWLFKPLKIGDWKYHDHLLPHQRGVITVVKEAEETVIVSPVSSPSTKTSASGNFWQAVVNFLKQIGSHFVTGLSKVFRVQLQPPSPHQLLISADEFKKLNPDQQFIVLKTLAAERGIEAVWSYFNDLFKGESGTSGNVHDLAHFMGSLIFENKGVPGLSICAPQFAFGCYHGFLDTAFKNNLDNLEAAEKGCLRLDSASSGPFASCIHGIGHGVASFYQTTDLPQALESCEKLTPHARTYCYDGVFMEFERDAPTNFYKATDPLYPCNMVEQKYVFACGRNQPNVLILRFQYSFDEVINTCLISRDPDLMLACFDSLGFIASSRANGNPQLIIRECSKIGDQLYQSRCSQAAAGELVFQETPNWQVSAPQVCGSLKEEFKTSCDQYVQKLIVDYGRKNSIEINN